MMDGHQEVTFFDRGTNHVGYDHNCEAPNPPYMKIAEARYLNFIKLICVEQKNVIGYQAEPMIFFYVLFFKSVLRAIKSNLIRLTSTFYTL